MGVKGKEGEGREGWMAEDEERKRGVGREMKGRGGGEGGGR